MAVLRDIQQKFRLTQNKTNIHSIQFVGVCNANLSNFLKEKFPYNAIHIRICSIRLLLDGVVTRF